MAATPPRLQILNGPDLPGLNVALRSVSDLTPNRRNARRHTAEQIRRLQASIEAFGFVAPIIIGQEDEVLAGEARLKAARAAGLEAVPTISLAHLPADAQRAYMLADNPLAELATPWRSNWRTWRASTSAFRWRPSASTPAI